MEVNTRQEESFQTPKKIIANRHSNEDIEIQDTTTVIEETLAGSPPASTRHVDEDEMARKKVIEKTINLESQDIISDSEEDDSLSSLVLDEDRALLRNLNESGSVVGPTDIGLEEPLTHDAPQSEGRVRPISELVDALAAAKSYCFKEPEIPISQPPIRTLDAAVTVHPNNPNVTFLMDYPPPTESLCEFVAQVLGEMNNPNQSAASSPENGQPHSHCLNCEGFKGVVERIESMFKVICKSVEYLAMQGISPNSPMRPATDERPNCSSTQMPLANHANNNTVNLSDEEEHFESVNPNKSPLLLVTDDEWSKTNPVSSLIQSQKKQGRGRPKKSTSTDSWNKSKEVSKRRSHKPKSLEDFISSESDTQSDSDADWDPKPKRAKISEVSKQKFACDKCPKSYAKKSRLNEHLVTHESPFECEICGTSYASKYGYERHLKTLTHQNNERKMAKAARLENAYSSGTH